MRTINYKAWIAEEADELAGEAFDRRDDSGWVQEAVDKERGDDAYSAALEVIEAAIVVGTQGPGPDHLARLRRCVDELKQLYIEHAAEVGLFAAEARDVVDGKRSDQAEADAEFRAELRAEEAAQAAIRG